MTFFYMLMFCVFTVCSMIAGIMIGDSLEKVNQSKIDKDLRKNKMYSKSLVIMILVQVSLNFLCSVCMYLIFFKG